MLNFNSFQYFVSAALLVTLLTGCGGADYGPSGGGSVSQPPYSSSSGAISVPPPPGPTNPITTPPKAGDRYTSVGTNPFVNVAYDPLSTFAVDVDTASYDIYRRDMKNFGQLPNPASVRLEEYVNFFDYQYPAPAQNAEHPFAIKLDAAPNVLDRATKILRVGIQATKPSSERKKANLVFLVDVSGSMASLDKLPLVKDLISRSLSILRSDDTVSIVTYASGTNVLLAPTPVLSKDLITNALYDLSAGGSTNGEAGIRLAYEQASKGFIEGGINHIILCTDGDFNLGLTSDQALINLITEKRQTGVTFTALGFGSGNLNDSMMEATSNAGNGTYAVIASENQAEQYVSQRILANITYVAKDMKIQVEFNPALVSAYRLLGYEDRNVADNDFRNDTVDAGEIGVGHRVTALYELVLKDDSIPKAPNSPAVVDGAKYSGPVEVNSESFVKVKVRYKHVDATAQDAAFEVATSLDKVADSLANMDQDFRWAVAVAAYAEILKRSPYADVSLLGQLSTIFNAQKDRDADHAEFVELFNKARVLIKP